MTPMMTMMMMATATTSATTSELTSLLREVITLVMLSVLTAIGIKIREVMNTRASSEKDRLLFDRVHQFMMTEVEAIEQAERPHIKAAMADGKIDAEELRGLRDRAIQRVRENLGQRGIDALQQAIGHRRVDEYLISTLESVLLHMSHSRRETDGEATDDRGSPGFAFSNVMAWIAAASGLVLLVMSMALHGCEDATRTAIRRQAINIGNAVTRVSDVESTGLLRLYCKQQMQALGHPADYVNGRCQRTDIDVQSSSATPEQTVSLANVRSRWAPVLSAHERVIRAHNVLGRLVNGGVMVTDGEYLRAMSELATAYDDLREASRTVGFVMPELLGGR
jgi:hypothetical protein